MSLSDKLREALDELIIESDCTPISKDTNLMDMISEELDTGIHESIYKFDTSIHETIYKLCAKWFVIGHDTGVESSKDLLLSLADIIENTQEQDEENEGL